MGLSARGCLALVRVAKTWAAADGRTVVVPSDITTLASPVLCHRLLLDPQAQFSGVSVDDVIERLLGSVAAPDRARLSMRGGWPVERSRSLRVPTATGRAVIVLALAAWAGSAYTDIVELRLVALMCALAVLLAVPWLLIPMRVRASLSLRPPRAVAGERVEISLSALNGGRLSLWQPLVHLPVGERDVVAADADADPGRAGQLRGRRPTTSSAGVLDVGPAIAVRTDPLGLLRKSVRWCDPIELYVRPRMVAAGHARRRAGARPRGRAERPRSR